MSARRPSGSASRVHFGDVVFGNAGTLERLKFGVIGRAVNEVARAEDMSKTLGHPVVTDAVASRIQRSNSEAAAQSMRSSSEAVAQGMSEFNGVGAPLVDLGLHELRGIPAARRLWALPLG